MRAALCTGNRSIALRDVPEPRPGPATVVVRVHACGICGSDLHYYTGQAPPPPCTPGHEICGRVASAPDTSAFAPGDPVVIEPLVSCGTCALCRSGQPNLCPALRILGAMAPGGLADMVSVPTTCLYRLPPGLDLDTAVLTEPLAVAVHAVRLAGLGVGDHVLVLGGGVIGLLAAFVAAASGARVTVSGRYPQQRAAAQALGVTTVLDAERESVRAACADESPDVVIEAVGGTAATLDPALEVVRPGGHIVVLGLFTQDIMLHPLRFLTKEVRLSGAMTYGRHGPRPDFARALHLLARERARLAPLVTHRIALDEIARAFTLAADKASGVIKVVVTV